MQSISEDALLQRLVFDNPWWGSEFNTEEISDHLTKRPFFPAFYSEYMNNTDVEYLVLAGPLGTGKTVMIRQSISKLLETDVPPETIFYCSLATPSKAGLSLERLLDLFSARNGHGPESKIYVFFDEVQYIKDWQQEIGELSGNWPKGRFAVSVSSGAPTLVPGMPTKGAENKAFVLPPLSFLEFLRFRGAEERLFGTGAEKAGAPMAVSPEVIESLNEEFYHYINYGGFPEGVTPRTEDAPPSAYFRDELTERVFHKDFASLAGVGDVRELNRLFAILAFNTAREVTIEELAKAVGVAKNTLRKYLDYLEHAFLIRRLPRVDRAAKPFQRAVAFKVYLTSPSLHTALFGPATPESEVFPRLVETALVSQWLGAQAVANLAYASWRGGAIDLLSINPETGKPDHAYEIDWQDTYAAGGKGPENLTAFVEETNPKAKVYILTNTSARNASMGATEIALVPAALYAYWLVRDPTLGSYHSEA